MLSTPEAQTELFLARTGTPQALFPVLAGMSSLGQGCWVGAPRQKGIKEPANQFMPLFV